MKKTLCHLIIAASLPVIVQTASAQTTILTDNFTVGSNGDANTDLGSRQTGTYAGSPYVYGDSYGGTGSQTGNPTLVGQPGGAANSNYLLMFNEGYVYNSLGFNDTVVGGNHALSISFNLYQQTLDSQDPTLWTSFSFGRGEPSPNQAGQFGFLVQCNQGLWVFDGNNSALNQYNNAGFVTSDSWTVELSDTAGGTGSPFDGSTYVKLFNNNDPANGMTGLGLVWSGQLTTPLNADPQIGFLCFQGPPNTAWNEAGVDNLNVVAAPEPSTYAMLVGGFAMLIGLRRK